MSLGYNPKPKKFYFIWERIINAGFVRLEIFFKVIKTEEKVRV